MTIDDHIWTYMDICMAMYMPFDHVWPYVLSVSQSVSLSVWLSVYLSICPFIYQSVCLFVCLSVLLSICSSVRLSGFTLCLSVCLLACLSISLRPSFSRQCLFQAIWVWRLSINMLEHKKAQVCDTDRQASTIVWHLMLGNSIRRSGSPYGAILAIS